MAKVFYISHDDGTGPAGATIWRKVNPGGGRFLLNDEEEAGEMFSREKLNGKLKLTRDDFAYIMEAPFSATFTLIVVREEDGPGLFQAKWIGQFHKTDCYFDLDESRVEFQPLTVDAYKTIMEGKEKEFDLIQLEPPLTSLQLTRRAILQVYVRGADKITNFVDSSFWETDVQNPSEVPSTLQGTYRFGYSGRKYFVTGSGTGLDPDVSGTYIYNSGTFESLREDGQYILSVLETSPSLVVGIRRASDGVRVYEGTEPIPNLPVEASQGVLLTSLTSGSQCRAFYVDFYSRILTNADTVDGSATFDIPATDILESHGAFTKIHQVFYTDFLTSEGNTTTGTRWGKFPADAQHFAGRHFTRPTGNVYYPVLRSNWVDASFWIDYSAQLKADMLEASEEYTLKHCYKVSDVVGSLLEAMGSEVGHEATSAFSNFLYGSNSIRQGFRTPVIIPITNVLVSDYDEPQQVAKIKLGEIFQLLKIAFRVFWDVYDGDKLRFEHINFFENGGSYSGPNVGLDLTAKVEGSSRKPWSHKSNKYSFEKAEMPERYEFGWSGKSSTAFDGFPLEVVSPFVEKGNVESWKIGRFHADIDLVHLGGAEISKDSFMFVDAIDRAGVLEAPFVDVIIDSEEAYNLQNGYAAFAWTVPNYHRYHLPALDIIVNKYPALAVTIARRRLQEIRVATSEEVTTLELTKTGLGEGKAYEIQTDVHGTEIVIKLRHANQ